MHLKKKTTQQNQQPEDPVRPTARKHRQDENEEPKITLKQEVK